MAPTLTDIRSWVQENEPYFSPPVCNKMLHGDGQMKVFFVGGPNVRKDFHLEEGEEFFFMLKGDMCLKVLERGSFKDIIIREGECFLLPGRIPHSPQRQANTVGLVIERERREEELDCLRYYVEGKTASLFERWFHCVDLGTQLPPVIQEFFASTECKTGQPQAGSVPKVRPYVEDKEKTMESPFSIAKWLKEHEQEMKERGKMNMFGSAYKFQVTMLGPGEHQGCSDQAETFLWQWEGECELQSGKLNARLPQEHTALVPVGENWVLTNRGFTIQVISCA